MGRPNKIYVGMGRFYKVIHNWTPRNGNMEGKRRQKYDLIKWPLGICVKALRVWKCFSHAYTQIQSSFFPFQKGSPWHVILFLAHKPKSIYFDQFSSLVIVILKAPIISKHGETAIPLPLTLTKDIMSYDMELLLYITAFSCCYYYLFCHI